MSSCVVNARFAGMTMTGVQRASYEIVRQLVLDDRERYHLVSPRLKANETSAMPIKQAGYLSQGHLWEQLELPRIVRRTNEKAILFSPMTSGPLAVSRQVMTIHDLFFIEHPEWYSPAFRTWYQWLIPRLVKKVAFIIANSQYTRQQVLSRFDLPENKVVVCHLAHNERFFPAPAEKVAEFRSKRGLPEQYVLCVGTSELRKNMTTLIAAWRRTLACRQGVKLVIAGADARKAVFNTAVFGLREYSDPTIIWSGYVQDEILPLLYQGAEAFVFPSLAEGFSLTILEAMACGTPVICSDATAMPETAGGAARLVPALDVEAWAETIDEILSTPDLRRDMRSAGIRRAANFSWTSTARKVRTILEAV